MKTSRFSRSCVVVLIGIIGLAAAVTGSASAQGPRLRPGVRLPQRDKELKAEGEARVEQPNPESAEEDSERTPAAQTYFKGVKALDKGDSDAAIKLFSKAIQLDSKYAPAYCDRGLALVIKGEFDKAVADLDTAIRLAPDGARSYFNRGFAYFQKGQYGKATADYTDAIRLHPGYAEAYRDRGYVRVLSGDLERAMPDLNMAVRLAPKDAAAYTSRGKAFIEMGDWDRAIADYSKAIATRSEGSRRLVRSRQCIGP